MTSKTIPMTKMQLIFEATLALFGEQDVCDMWDKGFRPILDGDDILFAMMLHADWYVRRRYGEWGLSFPFRVLAWQLRSEVLTFET